MIEQYDCFGSILKAVEGERLCFICTHCARPFAVLGMEGLIIESKHGTTKDTNIISVKTLKKMIADVEKQSAKASKKKR